MKFVAGIGIPVDLEPESMTIGYVFKAQYFLPYNVSQIQPTRLARDVAHMKVDKYGQAYERYDVEAEVTSVREVLPQNEDDDVRWVIYQTLENILRSKAIDGKQCVLRAVCEASRLRFTHESGLLGEIFHILFVWVFLWFPDFNIVWSLDLQPIDNPSMWIEKWLHLCWRARSKWWKLRKCVQSMHLLINEYF